MIHAVGRRLSIVRTDPFPSRLFPIPFLEQIGDGKLESRKEVFTLQQPARTDELALRKRVTHLDALPFRVNYPGDLRAAGEEVLEPLVDLGAGIVLRKDFDRQVRRAWKEPRFVGFESKRGQSGFGNEGDIWCPAIAVEHPETGAG